MHCPFVYVGHHILGCMNARFGLADLLSELQHAMLRKQLFSCWASHVYPGKCHCGSSKKERVELAKKKNPPRQFSESSKRKFNTKPQQLSPDCVASNVRTSPRHNVVSTISLLGKKIQSIGLSIPDTTNSTKPHKTPHKNIKDKIRTLTLITPTNRSKHNREIKSAMYIRD